MQAIAREGEGAPFPDEGPGQLIAPNITSDKETDVGNFTDDMLARAIRNRYVYVRSDPINLTVDACVHPLKHFDQRFVIAVEGK